MPQVTVSLYAGFREHVGGQAVVQMDIVPGETVGDVLARCQIPLDQVRIVFCNHRLVRLSHRLEGGERIGAFPAVGGG